MPLTRYGNNAFDWSRVYAVKVASKNFDNQPDKVLIFANWAGSEIGKHTVELIHSHAVQAWAKAFHDSRFAKFKTMLPLAIDMETVVSIVRDGVKQIAAITLELNEGRNGTLQLDADAAHVILETLGS